MTTYEDLTGKEDRQELKGEFDVKWGVTLRALDWFFVAALFGAIVFLYSTMQANLVASRDDRAEIRKVNNHQNEVLQGQNEVLYEQSKMLSDLQEKMIVNRQEILNELKDIKRMLSQRE